MTTPLAEWKPEYETGNTLVDEQHRGIFSIINALNVAMLEGQGEHLLEQTIQSVKEYTTIHFDTEEQYMRDQHYPDYEQHKHKHDTLKAKFDTFAHQQYPDVQQRTIVLANFLTTWLIQHIQTDDKTMIAVCRQAAVEQEVQPPRQSPLAAVPLAQWRPEYETGYTLIDDQHRSLFHAINALHSAILLGRGEELLERTLKILESYTTIHFETEEHFMVQFNYPEYLDHVEKHRALRHKVDDFTYQENQPHDIKLAIRVSRFLTDWLIHHIRDEDQRMITFLRETRQQQHSADTGVLPNP